MIEEIREIINNHRDETKSKKMSAYMKNQFLFAGIPMNELKELVKDVLRKYAKSPLDWGEVYALWKEEYREYQYVAIEYITKHRNELTTSDLDNLKYLIIHKSWWETVDSIDAFVGELVLKDDRLKEKMLIWARDDNIWIRRVAIDYQQRFKEKTDTDILEKVIVLSLGSKEFFINKAIGWSLREYSKTNPTWVIDFLGKYKDKISSLSYKEASKYIRS